ncbi:RING-type E3 ubiquitin transferase [Heracleum sosnowskyi]|uniref:RING-type E3 ubiquitin transferase n=1 Tax=Heracleum sosnowskyi TaxID=360622 RepID=A0AAD8JM74_9APIA|nr:RING-type E3 ubiquitin transferase [Heracleum sosnowskyi]
MFSGGSSTRGNTNTSQRYFCYQCNRNVTITSPSASSELVCPNCNGGFLEEIENPNPNSSHSDLNSNQNPFFSFSSDNLAPFPSFTGGSPFVFSTNLAGDDPTELTNIFSGGGGGDRADEFNPFAFLQNYLNTLRASGANIQFVVDGNNTSTNLSGANLGDYFIGPGLEQLIQQLAENDPNRYGTPPAAKSAVEALPVVKISKEMLGCDFSECAVCKESFGLDEEARQMPCKHIYHSDCIMPWLEMHNSCPVCRFELPTDDPEYENRARDGSGGAGGLQESAETPRTMERRFRIQLPWQVRTSGEGSNSRDGNDNAGGSNSGGQAREEDLD